MTTNSKDPAVVGPPDRPAHALGAFAITVAKLPGRDHACYLVAGTERGTKYLFARLYTSWTARVSASFLRELVEAMPCVVHTVETDVDWVLMERHRPEGSSSATAASCPTFADACRAYGIHRSVHPGRPWIGRHVDRLGQALCAKPTASVHQRLSRLVREHNGSPSPRGITPAEALRKALGQ